jgi:hypothetical protein
MSQRLPLCCLALVWISGAGGCGDRAQPTHPAAGETTGRRANAEVERRLTEAINEQGKHQVKSVELTRRSDGTYSGTVKTTGGETIVVTNVVVRENGISRDETIDQTGNGPGSH